MLANEFITAYAIFWKLTELSPITFTNIRVTTQEYFFILLQNKSNMYEGRHTFVSRTWINARNVSYTITISTATSSKSRFFLALIVDQYNGNQSSEDRS
jgi:hypothetical protein